MGLKIPIPSGYRLITQSERVVAGDRFCNNELTEPTWRDCRGSVGKKPSEYGFGQFTFITARPPVVEPEKEWLNPWD